MCRIIATYHRGRLEYEMVGSRQQEQRSIYIELTHSTVDAKKSSDLKGKTLPSSFQKLSVHESSWYECC